MLKENNRCVSCLDKHLNVAFLLNTVNYDKTFEGFWCFTFITISITVNHYGGHRGVKTILGAGMSQLLQRRTEKPGAILTWVRIPSAARDFYPYSQLSMQTLLRCPYSPRVRSRA